MKQLVVVFEHFVGGRWTYRREKAQTLDIDVRADGRVIVYLRDNAVSQRFEPCRFVTARALEN